MCQNTALTVLYMALTVLYVVSGANLPAGAEEERVAPARRDLLDAHGLERVDHLRLEHLQRRKQIQKFAVGQFSNLL